MATADYLKTHFAEDVDLSKIYRYMDKLYNTQKEAVQRISVEHTFSVLGGRVEMLFYDVTSLYFEVSGRRTSLTGILQGWQDSRDPDYPRTSCL